jgi:hypothetical protein
MVLQSLPLETSSQRERMNAHTVMFNPVKEDFKTPEKKERRINRQVS